MTGRESEPSELIYFKVYKSQIPVIEQAIETAALMLGTDKSRVSNNVGGAKHAPTAPDQVWTMDFTQDTFASGRRFRTLILMDGCTSEALEIEVDTSLPGLRVVRVLEGRKQQGRKPKHMIVDNGTEFTSHDLAIRCFEMLVYRLDCS